MGLDKGNLIEGNRKREETSKCCVEPQVKKKKKNQLPINDQYSSMYQKAFSLHLNEDGTFLLTIVVC